MKNIITSIVLAFAFCIPLVITGQIVTSNSGNTAVSNSAQGFYYSLPQTVLKIELVYEILESRKGPLASYANEYLGVVDYVSSDETKINLLDVRVTASVEPDPKQLYFVQFPAERPKDASPNAFFLNDIGGLSSYNTQPDIEFETEVVNTDINYIFNEDKTGFENFAQYNKRKKTDTVVRQISIDTVVIDRFIYKTSWVDKSSEDKAKEAAIQIETLRENRFNLLTGYHEVNFGSSIQYMDKRLKELETEYLELFIGKTSRTIESQTIYFIPSKNSKSTEIYRFRGGKSVNISIDANGSDKMPESPSISQNSVFLQMQILK